MHEHIFQLIVTGVVLLLTPISKVISSKIIWRYARISSRVESRTRHIIKVVSIFINLSCLMLLVIIWGVDPRNIFVALSSIFAIIGIAFFAQWSLLSNVTAGILLFFTTPFHIGDYVRIHDKDIPLEAEVIDILTFHIHLRTVDGELVIYPNSLLLQKGLSIINKPDIKNINNEAEEG